MDVANIFAWGSNSHGQLGLGSKSEQVIIAEEVLILQTNVLQIVGGGKHTLLTSSNGQIYGAGDNDRCQIEDEDGLRSNFQLIRHQFQPKVLKLCCGWDFNLCLLLNGDIFGWGSNTFGQLGVPLTKSKYCSSPHKIASSALDIAAGLRHSLFVGQGGVLYSTGANSRGQLGLKTTLESRFETTFTKVPGIGAISKISCGEHFSTALCENGSVLAWGDNKFGQLGQEPDCSKKRVGIQSVELPSKQTIRKICCGWNHVSLLTYEGLIINWGRNDYGQLGEIRECQWLPKLLNLNSKIVDLIVGSHHTIILTDKNKVLSWGWNEHGNCGNGSVNNVTTPVDVVLPKNFICTLIGTGAGHSFAVGKIIVDIKAPYNKHGVTNELKLHQFDEDAEYDDFFVNCILKNEPGIVPVGFDWMSFKKWINADGTIQINTLDSNYGCSVVNVAQCNKRIYNVQEKIAMTLSEYLKYWLNYCEKGSDSLYLKDWHFTRDYPTEKIYRVPKYFCSDWLNEYYDNHPELCDDYRFVYLGPKDSWTPLHCDVFTSFSWSVNITGRKRWLIIKPGCEAQYLDMSGNLLYDKNLTYNDDGSMLNVVQEVGEAIFIPSSWHHQVWNLENTLSINHNWINGANISCMWESMKDNLNKVKNEIKDCKDMDEWDQHCQLMLRALYGFNYLQFFEFMTEIGNRRMNALRDGKYITVYGDWEIGRNHLLYDIHNLYTVLLNFKTDDDVAMLFESVTDKLSPEEFCNIMRTFLDDMS